MDVHIDSAGNASDPVGELLRHLVAGLRIAACDLQIDWGRKSEVQNLSRDVRRLKEEDRIGEPVMKNFAQHDFVLARWAVIFLIE